MSDFGRTLALVLVALFASAAAPPSGKLLPRKSRLQLGAGENIALALTQLEHGAELAVKGPGVFVCVAKRSDERGVRVDLNLPGVAQETINLIPSAAGVAVIELPKGQHLVELSAWSREGSAGTAVFSLHMPGYKPPPVDALIPVSVVPSAPASTPVTVKKTPALPAEIKMLSKAPARALSGEVDPYWQISSSAPAVFRVTGPRVLTFEARRHVVLHKADQPTRVLVLRNGQAMMSALLLSEAAPLGDIETLQVEVPDGAHTLTLRTAQASGFLLRLRAP